MKKVKAGSAAHRALMALRIPHQIEAQNWQEALFHTAMRLKIQHHNGEELDGEKVAPLLELFEQAVGRGWAAASAPETLAYIIREETTPQEVAHLIEALAIGEYITEQDFDELIWITMPPA